MKPPNTQSPPPPPTNPMPEGWGIEDMRNPKYHSRVSTFWMQEADELRAKLAKSEAMYWRFRQIAESANQRLKLQCGEAAQRANDTEAEILNALHQFSSANHPQQGKTP